MFYLLWAALNIGLFIYFLLVCFKVVKLLRAQLGLAAAVILSLGLLSAVNAPNNEAQKAKEDFTFSLPEKETSPVEPTKIVVTKLEDNPVFSIELQIEYRLANDSAALIPIRASSFTNGLIAGNRWQAQVATATANGSKINYMVYGTMEWKLFSLTLYRQAKNYKGIIDIAATAAPSRH